MILLVSSHSRDSMNLWCYEIIYSNDIYFVSHLKQTNQLRLGQPLNTNSWCQMELVLPNWLENAEDFRTLSPDMDSPSEARALSLQEFHWASQPTERVLNCRPTAPRRTDPTEPLAGLHHSAVRSGLWSCSPYLVGSDLLPTTATLKCDGVQPAQSGQWFISGATPQLRPIEGPCWGQHLHSCWGCASPDCSNTEQAPDWMTGISEVNHFERHN